jgi:hypothetical protein
MTSSGSGTTLVVNDPWTYWIDMNGQRVISSSQLAPLNETPEQQRVRLEQERQWQEEAARQQAECDRKEAERKKKLEVADKRAEALFAEIVGEEQYKLFKQRKYHEIISPSGTRYRLRPGTIVDQMEGNFGEKVVQRLCIHHTYQHNLPPMDTLIHQMLMVRCGQEDEFQKTANKHQVAA